MFTETVEKVVEIKPLALVQAPDSAVSSGLHHDGALPRDVNNTTLY